METLLGGCIFYIRLYEGFFRVIERSGSRLYLYLYLEEFEHRILNGGVGEAEPRGSTRECGTSKRPAGCDFLLLQLRLFYFFSSSHSLVSQHFPWTITSVRDIHFTFVPPVRRPRISLPSCNLNSSSIHLYDLYFTLSIHHFRCLTISPSIFRMSDRYGDSRITLVFDDCFG